MADDRPAISGRQVMRLLRLDGWEPGRRSTHGIVHTKRFPDRVRVTTIPDKRRPLASGTLADILGPKQTGIGRDGLLRLIDQHGLK
jgi:predicted RNA binding protein YcfA (HicA-like mRNA interferase family)